MSCINTSNILPKTCTHCGVEFIPTSGLNTRCPDCRVITNIVTAVERGQLHSDIVCAFAKGRSSDWRELQDFERAHRIINFKLGWWNPEESYSDVHVWHQNCSRPGRYLRQIPYDNLLDKRIRSRYWSYWDQRYVYD